MAQNYDLQLLTPNANGLTVAMVGVWIQLVNNDTGTSYVSTGITNGTGKATFAPKPPGDTYVINTSAVSSSGPWTAFGISNHAVPVVDGDNPSFQSVTAQSSSPYAPRAAAGGEMIAGPQPRLDIGAYGTFTGTDDTTTLLAAIAAAPANSIIWVNQDPSGNPWITNSTLLINALNNVWFDGPGTIKLKNAANVPIIRFQQCIGGGVRNIGLDGNQANNTSPGVLGNQGVYIGNSVNGSTNVSVLGARIQNCYNDGVYVLNSNRCQVNDNYITGCGTSASGGTPIHFLQSSIDGEIIGNECDSNAYGIYLDNNFLGASPTKRTRIIGNSVTNCTGTNAALAQAAGISLTGSPYSICDGNVCQGSANLRGIELFKDSDHSIISNNQTLDNIAHNGIDFGPHSDIAVIGNRCENNGQNGIYGSGILESSIIGNVCRNNGQSAAGGISRAGIVLNENSGTGAQPVNDNVVMGNQCFDDQVLTTPVNATFTQVAGTLGAATYYYRVTALNANGQETLASTETSLAIAAGHGVAVNWAVNGPGVVSNKIYGRTTGAELFMAQVYGNSTTTWTDDGSITPSGALPVSNNTVATQEYGIRQWQGIAGYYLRNIISENIVRGNKTAQMALLSTTDTVFNNVGYGPSILDPAGTGLTVPADITVTAGTHGVINAGGALLLGAASLSNFLFNVTGAGNVAILGTTGKFTTYESIATAGKGVPAIYLAPAPLTGQTAAVASVATITSPNDAVKHTYMVSGFVTITTLGSGSFNLQVSYTDSNGTARTCNIPLAAQAGTFGALANTADDYKGTVEITVNPNTAVTIKTAGTFTGCTYNVGGNLKQVL